MYWDTSHLRNAQIVTLEPGMKETDPSSCLLLADRHSVLVEGLRDLLRTAFDSVYTVGDEASLRDGANRLRPSVIVISDVKKKSLQLTHDIQCISPGSKVVALVTNLEDSTLQNLLQTGASAVVLKTSAALDLLDAVDAVRRGEKFVSSQFRQLVS